MMCFCAPPRKKNMVEASYLNRDKTAIPTDRRLRQPECNTRACQVELYCEFHSIRDPRKNRLNISVHCLWLSDQHFA